MGGSIARKLFAKSAWRKVLSDVDDTLLSSGGRYPAGMDRRYGHHVLYPGVTRFYRELDLGTHPSVDDGEWPDERQGNLVFLSARPHVYKNMTEKVSDCGVEMSDFLLFLLITLNKYSRYY